MIYLYESHIGGLYVTDEELTDDKLYCEQCGDSDMLLCTVENTYDLCAVSDILKEKTDLFGSGGYDYKHTKNIYHKCCNLFDRQCQSMKKEDES